MRFVIEAADDGRLLRDCLRLWGVSGKLSAKLKRLEDGILLNGVRVTVRAVVHTGDTVDLAIEEREAPLHVVSRPIPVDVLLETGDFVVVNKQADVPTHPSHGHFEDTLANGLAYRYGSEATPFRPRFINRLDRNTTGIVLVAKHALAAATLSRAMANGEIQKTYVALVKGRLEKEQYVESGIRRREESIIFREVCPIGEGELSQTQVIPLVASDAFSLVQLVPHTGRTHQLRVHMASIGHPLLGDELYGDGQGMARHALHAVTLCFPSTEGGAPIRVCAPLPADMKEKIRELGEGAVALAEEKTH